MNFATDKNLQNKKIEPHREGRALCCLSFIKLCNDRWLSRKSEREVSTKLFCAQGARGGSLF